MKIALLNLPLDNNYGGNLQRYAMIQTLKKMGHDPMHISLRRNFEVPSWKIPLMLVKRAYLRYMKKQNIDIFYEWRDYLKYKEELNTVLSFYYEYIPHTEPIYSISQLKKQNHYDAYIVGSDQVWRKSYTGKNLRWYFFSFVKRKSPLLLAYAISFGKDENEYLTNDINNLKPLYERFKAVSVREYSGIDILNTIGFIKPKPVFLLDPTFLLTKDEYEKLYQKNGIMYKQGYVFCYILDINQAIDEEIRNISHKRNLTPFFCYINTTKMSIEQWICGISMSDYVVTDSYHGLVFSLIFNKPFSLIRNPQRGNARFDSILNCFGLKENNNIYNWAEINLIIEKKRKEGMKFLLENLK